MILDVPSTPAWYRRVAGCHLPLVGPMTGFEVSLDSVGVITAAVQHLAAQGCQRLGMISWRHEETFRQVVAAHGLTTRANWIRSDIDPAVRGAGWEEFREIWLDEGDHPEGILVLDDMLFGDAQLAILEMGVRIPQELHLVTLSARGASAPVRLPVTRLEINPEEEAQFLTDQLLAQLHGEAVEPVRHVGSFQLIPDPDQSVPAATPKEAANVEC